MNQKQTIINNETGFALVAIILILLVMVIVGITNMTKTTIEIDIATSDKIHKDVFYEADAGTELGSALLEQNLACQTGFPASAIGIDTNNDGIDDYFYDNDDSSETFGFATFGYHNDMLITVENLMFWQNIESGLTLASDTNRDFYFPANYDQVGGSGEHTNFTVGGITKLARGSSLQMTSGYEGVGKGSAGSGAYMLYCICSQRFGIQDTEKILLIQWRHLIGQEENCLFAR